MKYQLLLFHNGELQADVVLYGYSSVLWHLQEWREEGYLDNEEYEVMIRKAPQPQSAGAEGKNAEGVGGAGEE